MPDDSIRYSERRFAGWCVVIFLRIATCLPLGSALEIGGDEGFELIKAFLCHRGYTLYEDVWNDQPPAHTLLLAGLFSVTGPSLLAARLLAAGFGALLVWIFAHWIRGQTGFVAAAAGVGILMAAPMFLTLAVSVMLEVPAFALGLCAGWFLEQRRRLLHPSWIVGSALTLAAALQVKLTAGILMPALLLQLLLSPGGSRLPDSLVSPDCEARNPGTQPGTGAFRPSRFARLWAHRLLAVSLWLGTLVGNYALMARVMGSGGYDQLWAFHHSPALRARLASEQGYRLTLAQLADFPEGVAGAFVGIGLLVWRKDWHRLLFPLVWLATALLVHLHHRPWWDYYMLHLAIPLAWLFALAMDAVSKLRGGFVPPSRLGRWAWAGALMVQVLLISLATVYGGERLAREFLAVRSSERIAYNPLVQTLRHYAPRAHWMFTRNGIYAFHARVLPPPPLAVLPAKRFWSGQLSEAELLSLVRGWQPEMLLVGEEEFKAGWESWLDNHYILATRVKYLALFVHKHIADTFPMSPKLSDISDLEKRLGL
jgi:hypothetical protein